MFPLRAIGSGDNRLTVTTAGTAVQFPSQSAVRVIIKAFTNNTDVVVVGGSTVVAAQATRRGIPLFPGESLAVDLNNLNILYLDSIVSAEGVSYIFFTA